MYHIIHAIVRWISPILSYTADEIWEHIPGDKENSVFLTKWYKDFNCEGSGQIDSVMSSDFWETVLSVRAEVYREIEAKRNSGTIRSSLDAEVVLYADSFLESILEKLGDELRFVLITSEAKVFPFSEAGEQAVQTGLESLKLSISASSYEKCIRCWHKRPEVGNHQLYPSLCDRCILNISGEGEHRLYA